MKIDIEFTSCHRKPERSFFWRGIQFPICARCTGIHLGYLAFPVFTFSLCSVNLTYTICLILPTIIDWFTQEYFKRESNNFIRLLTGFIAGIGVVSLTVIIGQYLGNLILSIIH